MNSRDLINNKIVKQIRKTPIIVSILALLVMVYDIGYAPPSNSSNLFQKLYFLTLLIGASSTIARYVEKETRPRLITIPFDIALFTLLSTLIFQYITIYLSSSPTLLLHPYWIYLAIVLIFIREFSALKVSFKKTTFNPAQLFILSFLSLIILGTILLLLPNATHNQIMPVDALFTSTSAVCVTGLIVVDTGTFFTQFGQIIILLLIQAGGIGIMTFTSYFSYFFKGVSSYQNQLLLSQLTNTEKIAEVFTVLKKIILITFSIEAIGAFLIFQSINHSVHRYLFNVGGSLTWFYRWRYQN